MNLAHSGSWLCAQLMSFASSVKNPSIETLLKTDKVRIRFSEAGESGLDSPAIRMRTPGFDSLLFAHLAQQTQDFQVQPDQRNGEREGAVPLHVLWRALIRTLLDEVEIDHQVQRGDDHHEHAEQDAERAALMDEADGLAEHAHDHAHEIQQRDAAGGCNHADIEIVGILY